MTDDGKVLDRLVTGALSGKNSHAGTADILAGLRWKDAGAKPGGSPHSIFQLANHMVYWQEWVVKWLDGRDPKPPKHAAGGWPGGEAPASRQEWAQTVRRFRDVRAALKRRSKQGDLLSKRGEATRLEMFQIIASHDSYHAGQVVLLRQMLGAWPPPSGGITW